MCCRSCHIPIHFMDKKIEIKVLESYKKALEDEIARIERIITELEEEK